MGYFYDIRLLFKTMDYGHPTLHVARLIFTTIKSIMAFLTFFSNKKFDKIILEYHDQLMNINLKIEEGPTDSGSYSRQTQEQQLYAQEVNKI